MLPNFAYVRPGSVKDAIKHLSSAGAKVHAGGTDLLSCFRDETLSADKVVSLSGIGAVKGVKGASGQALRIGAMTTIAAIAKDPIIQKQYTALAQGAAQVASPQIRNQGTLGGNLCQRPWCWYFRGGFNCVRKGGDQCFAENGDNRYHAIFGGEGVCFIVHPSDTAPALIALNASLQIEGKGGSRTVPVEKFFVGPGDDPTRETVLKPDEMVVEVQLPAPPAGLRSSYRKVRERQSWDFALAGVALALQFDGDKVAAGRVVLSGVAPVPWRAEGVEKAIVGKKLDAGTIAAAAEAAVKGAEALSHNAYKIPLVRGVIEEQLEAIAKA